MDCVALRVVASSLSPRPPLPASRMMVWRTADRNLGRAGETGAVSCARARGLRLPWVQIIYLGPTHTCITFLFRVKLLSSASVFLAPPRREKWRRRDAHVPYVSEST